MASGCAPRTCITARSRRCAIYLGHRPIDRRPSIAATTYMTLMASALSRTLTRLPAENSISSLPKVRATETEVTCTALSYQTRKRTTYSNISRHSREGVDRFDGETHVDGPQVVLH